MPIPRGVENEQTSSHMHGGSSSARTAVDSCSASKWLMWCRCCCMVDSFTIRNRDLFKPLLHPKVLEQLDKKAKVRLLEEAAPASLSDPCYANLAHHLLVDPQELSETEYDPYRHELPLERYSRAKDMTGESVL